MKQPDAEENKENRRKMDPQNQMCTKNLILEIQQFQKMSSEIASLMDNYNQRVFALEHTKNSLKLQNIMDLEFTAPSDIEDSDPILPHYVIESQTIPFQDSSNQVIQEIPSSEEIASSNNKTIVNIPEEYIIDSGVIESVGQVPKNPSPPISSTPPLPSPHQFNSTTVANPLFCKPPSDNQGSPQRVPQFNTKPYSPVRNGSQTLSITAKQYPMLIRHFQKQKEEEICPQPRSSAFPSCRSQPCIAAARPTVVLAEIDPVTYLNGFSASSSADDFSDINTDGFGGSLEELFAPSKDDEFVFPPIVGPSPLQFSCYYS